MSLGRVEGIKWSVSFCDAKVILLMLSLQACRGDALDDGLEVDSAGDATDCSFSLHLSVPVDTAVMYATPPGKHQAFNRPPPLPSKPPQRPLRPPKLPFKPPDRQHNHFIHP